MSDSLSPETLAQATAAVKPLCRGFDAIADHVVITDADAHILYANAAVERGTGFPVADVLGKNPSDLWGGHMAKELYERFWHRIKQEKKPFIGEVKNVDAKGQEYWQELRVSPVLDDAGNVQYFIGIEPAIGDRKKNEAFERELLSIVGHESMSPATAVRWILELMLEHKNLTADEHAALREAYNQSDRLIDLLRDLIFLSRMGGGHPDLSTLDLSDVIARIAREARQRYSRVRIEIQTAQGCMIRGALSVIERLLWLIVSERADLLEQSGGTIVLSMTKKDDRCVLAIKADAVQLPPTLVDMRKKLLMLSIASLHWEQPRFERKDACDYLTFRIPLVP